jgi:hypothetical protein
METNDDNYRAQLIKAVQVAQANDAAEEAHQMTDEELLSVVTKGYGLQPGFQPTNEQLEMLIKARPDPNL